MNTLLCLTRIRFVLVLRKIHFTLDDTIHFCGICILMLRSNGVRQAALEIKEIDTELHDHANTVHGIKDLLLAQNRDVHVLAIKKLVAQESIDNDVFPEHVRAFARKYHKQKKDLLFINQNGVLCVKYPPQQRPLHERPCMIVMPQLYQHEILFRAHDAMGHQGTAKELVRIQERHTWPGLTCVSRASKYGTNRVTFDFTSKISKVGISMS